MKSSKHRKRKSIKGERILRVAFTADADHIYARRIALGISRYANPQNGLILREFLSETGSATLPASLTEWAPDIVISFLSSEYLPLLLERVEESVPIVSTARLPADTSLPVIACDLREGFRLVCDHFTELGIDNENVWLFGSGESKSHQSSFDEYHKFASENSRTANYFQIEDPPSFSALSQECSFARELEQWLLGLQKPAGIFSDCLYAGQLLCRACEVLKVQVPQEIAIIGVDSFEIANSTRPPVTSLVAPAEEIGKQAAKVASNILNGDPQERRTFTISGSHLVKRESSKSKESSSGCDIDAALAFIDAYACSSIKVSDVICQTQGVSRKTFHKRFLERTGKTPAKMITDYRMREARRLLGETALSTNTIAATCGYVDYIHFYKVFREYEGVSPSAFRRICVTA